MSASLPLTSVQTTNAAEGGLWLVPTPLDFGISSDSGIALPLAASLPEATIARASTISHWVVENAKSARAFLKRVAESHPLAMPLQAQTITEMPRQAHKDPAFRWDAKPLLEPALQGHAVGLLSEAGMPAVADPGSEVVRAAHRLGLPVRPLVGPSALLMALAASGGNGQQFSFHGYLSVDASARARQLRELEARTRQHGDTQLFIEVPHRNAAMLEALLGQLQASTCVFVAGGLATPASWVRSGSVASLQALRQAKPPTQPLAFAASELALPCVFGVMAPAPGNIS